MTIDVLTADQVDALRAHHAQWYAHGISTAPSDRPGTEKAITRIYELVGKSLPSFIWCDSPAAAALTIAGLPQWNTSLRDKIYWRLGEMLRDSLEDGLESLGVSLRNSLSKALSDSLVKSLRYSLTELLLDSLGESLGRSLRDSQGDRVRTIALNDAAWGQHDSIWVAAYDFVQQQGLATYSQEDSERLDLWATTARSSGWWFPYEGVVVCTERPSAVRQELEPESWEYGVRSYRLHCEDGPALEYRDGWAVYAWHGVRVAEWVITKPDVEWALRLSDPEQRQAALDRAARRDPMFFD